MSKASEGYKDFHTQLKEAAHSYFKNGLAIVPLDTNRKPLVEWGVWEQRAQTEEEFSALPWERAFYYAVLCGTKTKQGFYFGGEDRDSKNKSPEAITRGREIVSRLPKTRVDKTPHEGEHYPYFSKTPVKSFQNLEVMEKCGIEVLGKGDLMIMPPSQGYSILEDREIAIVDDLNSLVIRILVEADVIKLPSEIEIEAKGKGVNKTIHIRGKVTGLKVVLTKEEYLSPAKVEEVAQKLGVKGRELYLAISQALDIAEEEKEKKPEKRKEEWSTGGGGEERENQQSPLPNN